MKILIAIVYLFILSSCMLLSKNETLHIYLPNQSEGWGAIVYMDSKNGSSVQLDQNLIGTTSLEFNTTVSKDGKSYYVFHQVSENGDTKELKIENCDSLKRCINSLFFLSYSSPAIQNTTVQVIQFHVGVHKEENTDDSQSEFGKFETRLQKYIDSVYLLRNQ